MGSVREAYPDESKTGEHVKTKITFSMTIDKPLSDIKEALHRRLVEEDGWPAGIEEAWDPEIWMQHLIERDPINPECWKVEEIDDSKVIPEDRREEVKEFAYEGNRWGTFDAPELERFTRDGVVIKGINQMTDLELLACCGLDEISWAEYVRINDNDGQYVVGHDPETNEPIFSKFSPDDAGEEE